MQAKQLKWTHPQTDLPNLFANVKSFVEYLLLANSSQELSSTEYSKAFHLAKYLEFVLIFVILIHYSR